MNEILALIDARTSTRVFDPTPLTAEEKRAILHAALRAPTAGNQVAYSIIEVEDRAMRERLVVTCDDQSFIAKAPWVLVFLADHQKWIDLYAASGVEALPGAHRALVPGMGELMMACSDALVAAQTAVIAAESLGIGSCYIGDILENGEEHAEMFALPPYTMPVAMLCLGRPLAKRAPTPHYGGGLVHRDRYRRLDAAQLAETSQELEAMHAPHGLPPGVENYGQHTYARKFTAAYQREMNRSASWWMRRWETAE